MSRHANKKVSKDIHIDFIHGACTERILDKVHRFELY